MKHNIFILSVLCTMTLFSCSKNDSVQGDPQKDWSKSTERYISEATLDEQGFKTFYTPVMGRVGDPMPFYDQKNGNFKVLYLQEYKDNMAYRYHPIWTVQTTDGASYEGLGEWLSVGANDYQQDAALGTGCCYYNEKDGLYYIYYTGHNPQATFTEAVMRATSSDLQTWTRDDAWQLNGADFGYSSEDFRDPQIFVADDGLYRMIISTRPSYGGDPKFAEFKSSDMKNWEHVGMFNMVWNRMCECPDVFKMGDWWYLIYSDADKQNWSRKVKYMKAHTWDDLKACFNDPGANWPDWKEGVLDSRGFYAGKTASNGTDRLIWGWCPFREGNTIDEMNVNVGGGGGNEPKWSGALVCHKIVQHENGVLTLTAVPGIASKFSKEVTLNVMKAEGYNNGTLSGDNAYVMYNRLGNANHISMTVKTAGNSDRFGISLVRSTDDVPYYTMMIQPENDNWRKLNFEQEGVDGKGFIEGIDGYGFDRPADNTYKIDIYTDNSVMVMYINDNVCYTNRIYGIQKNCWSINNYGGSITISDVKVTQY